MEPDKCPKCGSTELAGLYASFWAVLDENGEDTAANFDDHQSSTELTDKRMCQKCHHEFEL